MARIRSLKPEFWDSPGIESLDPYARLLYVAMWNWADDSGRGKAEPRELMGFAFPRDDDMTVADFRRFLGEVRRVFGVDFYKVDGRSYYVIPTWEKHQKIDKRSASRWPSPDQGKHYDPATNQPADLRERTDSWVLPESPPSPRRDEVAGTGEQGNRGTGEQGGTTSSTGSADGPSTATSFAAFWEVYPRKEARGKAEPAYRRALKRASAAQILVGARRYRDDPNREQQFTKIPTSWLNSDGWGDDPLPARAGAAVKRTTDDKVRDGIELARRLAAQEASQQLQIEGVA